MPANITSGSNKTIFLSVPQGYYARNILLTPVMDYLLEDESLNFIILSPAYEESGFRGLLPQADGRTILSDMTDYRRDTQNGIVDKAIFKTCQWFKCSRMIFLPLITLFAQRRPTNFYRRLFETYRPTLVLTTTYGFDDRDIPLIRESKRYGVATFCSVHSWDNLLTKGIMLVRPDRLAVWNEIMKEEARSIHHYDPDDVVITGPPHFDIYQDRNTFLSRKEFFENMGLDPAQKLITVTAAGPNPVDNTCILQMLEAMRERGDFSEPIQILFRTDPFYALNQRHLTVYRKFEEEHNVKVDYAGSIVSDRIGWLPAKTDMVHLANTLKHSDIIVNIASTITIEAALVDRPVINIGFCNFESPYYKRVFNSSYKKHFRYILERNGSSVVKNEGELADSVNAYLRDPSKDREGRRAIARDICYKLDGCSSERLAAEIMRYCR